MSSYIHRNITYTYSLIILDLTNSHDLIFKILEKIEINTFQSIENDYRNFHFYELKYKMEVKMDLDIRKWLKNRQTIDKYPLYSLFIEKIKK